MSSVHDFDTLAHRLLNGLETRHDRLLDELDLLDQRVDAVLSRYTQVRPDVRPAPRAEDYEAEEDELESGDE